MRNGCLATVVTLIVLLIGRSANVGAQQPLAVFKSTVAVVPISVVVHDSHGHVVTSLTSRDFEILDKGEPRPIIDFRAERNSAVTIAILVRLHGLGLSIALDDFGTGYSSLSYLRSFPFDKIKIDRSFVRDLTTRADAMAIVRAVTGLANSLGIATTAEGVETAEQLSVLKAEGCTEVQGFHFGAPRSAREIEVMLSRKGLRLVAG